MKCLTLLLILFLNLYSKAQPCSLIQNLTGQDLCFRMHVDSVNNIYPIIKGVVITPSDTIVIDTTEFDPYKSTFTTKYYIDPKVLPDSLSVILYFCYEKLIEIEVSSDDPEHFENGLQDWRNIVRRDKRIKIKHYWGHIPSMDTARGYERYDIYIARSKFVYFYLSMNYRTDQLYVSFSDRKAYKHFPTWCGNTIFKRDFEDTRRYLERSKACCR